jgi:hypothetical protein
MASSGKGAHKSHPYGFYQEGKTRNKKKKKSRRKKRNKKNKKCYNEEALRLQSRKIFISVLRGYIL